jgi:starch synthase
MEHHPEIETVTLVAAEFKSLAKVGGLADVVADLALHLTRRSIAVRVLLPGYGPPPPGALLETSVDLPFGAGHRLFTLYHLDIQGTAVYLIHEPGLFDGENASIYIDSNARHRGPFEDDAQRFAFFCSACAWLLEHHFPASARRVVHCHDWHTGTLPLLIRMTTAFPRCRRTTRFMFTIHNLDYQGIRPLWGHAAESLPSLQSWFPDVMDEIATHPEFSSIRDPAHPHCYNPMRTGIRLSHQVTTVSRTYAREILLPDHPGEGRIGGRGLESDLQQVSDQGRLTGILNGIDPTEYDPQLLVPPFGPHRSSWVEAKQVHKARVLNWLLKPDPTVATSRSMSEGPSGESRKTELPLAVVVSRLVHQKIGLLLETTPSGDSALQQLDRLPLQLVILGLGELEPQLRLAVQNLPHGRVFLFSGFSPEVANRLYAAADLFLMPSLFEPCGISQLIAMRFGGLPVAHLVGGLADTVMHASTGFTFKGTSTAHQANRFVETVQDAVELFQSRPATFRSMQVNAMKTHFTWDASTLQYAALYEKMSTSDAIRHYPGT